ncbi:MAG: c-type cytochrome [Caldimonas sp.]
MNARACRPVTLIGVLGAVALALGGCGPSHGGSTASAPPRDQPGMDAIHAVPLGDVAGGAESNAAADLPNPYAGNPQAVQQGHDLFIKMNCAGCHGYKAKGGMGPNLTDGYWRYGGVPVSVFKSIYEGRPQGMPAWNPALQPQDIWKIVAYLQSLGGTYPANAYQAWAQGDRPGEQVPDEVNATLKKGFRVDRVPKPTGESATPPAVPSTPDASPPKGIGQ